MAAVSNRFANAVRGAVTYRWLTDEPDPDVVVIDLHNTWTVGPPLAIVDGLVDAVVPGVEGATVVAAIERSASVVRERPVALASAVGLGTVLASAIRFALAPSPSLSLLLVHLALAGIAVAGLRSTATLDDLRETRTAAVLVASLEPPEQPTHQADASTGQSMETCAAEDDADVTEGQDGQSAGNGRQPAADDEEQR